MMNDGYSKMKKFNNEEKIDLIASIFKEFSF